MNKDGAPYIEACNAGQTVGDPRSQGYTLCAQMVFRSLDDMKYYDEQCEAHAALKAAAKGKIEPPPMVVYFEDAAGSS